MEELFAKLLIFQTVLPASRHHVTDRRAVAAQAPQRQQKLEAHQDPSPIHTRGVKL
jgi:hypothetical protein